MKRPRRRSISRLYLELGFRCSIEQQTILRECHTPIPMSQSTVEIFFSYAHEDEALRDKLAKHLKLLERQGVIQAWHDRNITAGEEWKSAIEENMRRPNLRRGSLRCC